ncbi:hypothetical protein [Kitasatospora sp. NPDC058046]|uniref:hypothetical protein n=1 Tax=Kitasatospora sp. NPDC058046 TaxID=3346312 RepID=UPI0036DB94BE
MFDLPLDFLFAKTSEPSESSGIPSSPGSIELNDPLAIENQLLRLRVGGVPDDVLTTFRASPAGIVDHYEKEGTQRLAGEARIVRATLHSMLVGQQLPAQRAPRCRAGDGSGCSGVAGRPDGANQLGLEPGGRPLRNRQRGPPLARQPRGARVCGAPAPLEVPAFGHAAHHQGSEHVRPDLDVLFHSARSFPPDPQRRIRWT